MPFQWAVRLGAVLVAACAAGVAVAADSQSQAQSGADCSLPAYVRHAIRGAERIDLVRLGPPGDCVVDPLEPNHDPGCFAGYRRADWFRLPPEGVERASGLLCSGNLACAATGKGTGPVYVVGFDVAGEAGTVRVTLRLPAGDVEFEIPNGRHFPAALSSSGLREWRRLLAVLAARAGRPAEEFERDLARDAGSAPAAGPAPVASAPDTSANHAVAPVLHPVVPDTPARPIKKVPPHYPDTAREAGVEGTVKLSVLVGRDGHVHDVRVLKGIPMLDAAAVEAVTKWAFQPGKRGGKTVDSWFELPVKFPPH